MYNFQMQNEKSIKLKVNECKLKPLKNLIDDKWHDKSTHILIDQGSILIQVFFDFPILFNSDSL